jgi:hypothetical protein
MGCTRSIARIASTDVLAADLPNDAVALEGAFEAHGHLSNDRLVDGRVTLE